MLSVLLHAKQVSYTACLRCSCNSLLYVLVEHLNGFSINNQLALLLHHGAWIATMSRIIPEHVYL